jgi:siderophore synthetase component
MAVMADAHVEEEIKLRDLESARDAYKVNPDQANKTASHIMRYNLVIVFLLVIINCLAVYFLWNEAAMLAIASNFIGIVMNSLLSERSAVVGFFFGSSLGSKMKGDK